MGAAALIRLRRDLERLWPALAALAAAGAFWVLLALVSHGVNRPPVVDKVQLDPPRAAPGQTAKVRIFAMDPDGDRLTYECAAEWGHCTMADKTKPEAAYRPAERGSIADRITVTVTDRGQLVSTGSVLISIERPAASGDPSADAPAPAGSNQPPVLKGGSGPLYPEGDKPLVLEAWGRDPDGDEVTFNWDFGSCLLSSNAEISRAEVRLRPDCESGNAALTWTDSQGATARTEWSIHR